MFQSSVVSSSYLNFLGETILRIPKYMETGKMFSRTLKLMETVKIFSSIPKLMETTKTTL